MNSAIAQWVITLVIIAAAVAHVLVPSVTIDPVAITLLAMTCVPWAGHLFSTLEITGLLKIKGKVLEKLGNPFVESGSLSVSGAPNIRPRRRHVYAFEAVAGGDRNMVLAGLRIELEGGLRKIAQSRGLGGKRKTLRSVIGDLAHRDIVRRDEAKAIADLLTLLNRAVHGAAVDRAALEWALDVGPRLLDALEEHLGDIEIPELIVQWRHRDGALFQEVGMDLSKALVKSPRAFLRAMANDPESFDSWTRGIEAHTFTIHEANDELEDDLYTAYYEKLKALMEDRLHALVATDLDNEASRVLSALSEVAIRRIW